MGDKVRKVGRSFGLWLPVCVYNKYIMEALYSGPSALSCLSSVRAFQHIEDLVWGCTDVNVSVLVAAPAAHLSPMSISVPVAVPAALKPTAAASNSLPRSNPSSSKAPCPSCLLYPIQKTSIKLFIASVIMRAKKWRHPNTCLVES